MIGVMDVEQVRAMLAPLWAKNRDHILDRLGHVRQALLDDGPPSEAVRGDLHALGGTLGTYGWPDGSILIERIHQCLTSDDDTTRDRSELVGELDQLTATLSEA
jgi:hypothetical protein